MGVCYRPGMRAARAESSDGDRDEGPGYDADGVHCFRRSETSRCV
jgi:hypothetical protein